MEIMVNAVFAGHDLAQWQYSDESGGWQSACRYCTQTVWVSRKGLHYSLLENLCPGLQ
jgi:hypothetical protein